MKPSKPVQQGVFISYSRKNTDIMRRVAHKLQAEGYSVVNGEHTLSETAQWDRSIGDVIKNAGCVLLLMTPESKESNRVRAEVEYARKIGIPLIPMLVQGDIDAVPVSLMRSQWLDLRGDHFESGVNNLVDFIPDDLRTSQGSSDQEENPTTGQIFISYRRGDSADVTGRIYDRLIARHKVFKDVDSIPLSVDFKAYLDDAIKQSKVVLVVIGKQWLEITDEAGLRRLDNPTDYVRLEIEAALEQYIPVIPLLVQGASMPPEDRLPPSLKPLVYRAGMPVRPDPDFHRDMDYLITQLERVGK